MFAYKAVLTAASFCLVWVGPLKSFADLYPTLFLNLDLHWARVFTDNLLELPGQLPTRGGIYHYDGVIPTLRQPD